MLGELAEQALGCLNRLSELTTCKNDQKTHGTTHPDIHPANGIAGDGLHDLEFTPSTDQRAATMMRSEELDSAFRELLTELNLDPEKESQLWKQPAEMKWLMLVEQHARNGNNISNVVCDNLTRKLEGYVKDPPDKYTLPLVVQHLDALAISLRTECVSFVQRFIDSNGVELLSELLKASRSAPNGDLIATPVLNCFRTLLNTQIGRNYVVGGSDNSHTVLLAIYGAIDFNNARCKVLSLEILSGLCLVLPSEGHKAVLRALSDATRASLFSERVRFQKLVDELHRGAGQSPRERERVRIALMSLVNSLLKTGPSEQSLEFRLHLRYEFLMLGIQEVIDKLRGEHGVVLEDHFDLFEMMRQEDEQEMNGSVDSGSSSPIDIESPAGMAEALSHKLDNTLALPHFISLLQHMLMIPGDESHLHVWRLFDLVVQQLSLHTALGDFSAADPLFADRAMHFNMDELASRLRSNHECERLQKQLEGVSLELESERRRVVELENRLGDIQDGLSLSSFSRISDLSSSPSDPCHSPTLATDSRLPPIKPPANSAPPPPPPSAMQLRPGGGIPGKPGGGRGGEVIVKKVPKPPFPLRTLNWTPVPQNKIAGTIWEKIEDEKLYSKIDLRELNNSFFAGKGGGGGEDGDANATLQRKLRHAVEPVLISVIDARRAQNCTIMLSKLRLSNREIRQAIWSMDERGQLPKDMLEQMLKFIPTKEELILLRETLSKHKSPAVLAMADRYLLEVGQIPRFEQRLRCLHIMRTFKERLDELLPYFNAVIRASTTISSSKKLKHFMALVLAIGNYLNHGKRSGNAHGFDVHSLHSIHQVKSALRGDRNLMHFIVNTVEESFPELLRLKKELASVYEASRYNRTDMEVEFRLIESSLRELANELAVVKSAQQKLTVGSPVTATATCSESSTEGGSQQQSQTTNKSPLSSACKFVPVVTSFLESGRKLFKDAQGMHLEMGEKFAKCARLFAVDDPTKCSPDEFFGSFAKSLNQLNDCCQLMWEERAEAERTKRQTLSRHMLTKKNGKKQASGKGDFEGLINALQSGEIFSDDLNRLRASVRRSSADKKQQQKRSSNGSSIITVNIG